MNLNEKKMLSILKEGKEKYSYVGIKAEFEAEGTRSDEMLRLSEIVRKANLNIGIKIGGCEAVSDLYQTRLIGADYIIAPMAETPYAVSKYIEAKNKVYSEEERKDVRFLFNLETITAFNNLEGIAKAATVKDGADGMVFGRVDFVGSMGLSRDHIASGKISEHINKSAKICQDNKLDFVVGGGVAKETIDSVSDAKKTYLTRFETRKVIFNAEALDNNADKINKALENAVHFELLWLQNKQDYYSQISKEDQSRIEMLSKRFNLLSDS
ncbi:MAG: hypothetical protein ACJAS6_000165 [Rickettsiales bacterium]|jgi:hypothetical protein